MRINLRLWLLTLFFSLVLGACAGGPKPIPKPDTTEQTNERPDQEHTTLSDLERAQLKAAVENINQNKLDIAKKSLLKLKSSTPKNSLVFSNLAAIAFAENRLDDASELSEQALSISAENAQAHNIHGLILVERGNISSAEQAYLKALNIDSNYTNAHFNLALIYDIYYQDLKRAIQHYQAYLALSNFQDKQTLEWVQELERSLENQQ